MFGNICIGIAIALPGKFAYILGEMLIEELVDGWVDGWMDAWIGG